jgi:high-affinity iron transporter
VLRKLLPAFLSFFTLGFAYANQGESSRVLIHTLNYLSHDYIGAVKDGQIINQSEFHEMREFGESAIKYFNECSADWSDSDSVAIRVLVYRLDSLIEKHAPYEVVSGLALETKNKVVLASGIKITPNVYPSLDNGKVIYKTECAKCHGDNGYGDGPEGKDLSPRPRNFHDDEKMGSLSPFFIFNTVRLGVEGTGMKAHPTLEDEEVWDVAYYVLTFRYVQYKNDPLLKSSEVKAFIDSISLDKVSTSADNDFLKIIPADGLKNRGQWLAAIRFNQPVKSNIEFINTSIKYLDGAMALYLQGKYNEASQLTTLSYLEGIEPLEMQLKSNDPQLMGVLEDQLHRLSKMMEEQKPATEVKDSIDAAKRSISNASEILSKKEYSFFLALFMAVSILLREGLEAFLVIMVVLSILKATNINKAALWVHAGWITAVLSGVVIWFISDKLMVGRMDNMELLEGGISILSVFMLLYIGFWLHGKSEINRWKEYVNDMMKTAIQSGSMFGLAGLSFFVVFREVFESVLFLSALNIESGGKQSNAIIMGIVIAFVIVGILAVFLLRFSAKLPIPKLFKISSFVMGVLAIVLAGKGVHSLQETGIVPIHGLNIIRIELAGIFPTIETCVAQIVVLIALIFMWNTKLSSGNKPK